MTLIGFGVVIAKIVGHGLIAFRHVALIEFGVLALSLSSLAISPTILALVAVGVGSTGIIPQVVRAARTSHLIGVSVATYLIIAVMSSSWFVYGLMIDDLFVSAPNVIIVPCSTFITYRAIRSHRRHSRTAVTETLPAR